MHSKVITRSLSIVILLSLILGTSLAVHAAKIEAPAQTTTRTFVATADALVKSAYPDTNFGSDTLIRARGTPVVHSYIRFVISGINAAPILSAKLMLYSTNGSSTPVKVKAQAGGLWDESTITYNNAPAIGSLLGSTPTTFGANTWQTIDVSSSVKNPGTYQFVLTTANGNAVDFGARESGSAAPRLVLTLGTSVAPAPTIAETSWQPAFPIRATFYYPWFPQAWTQSGIFPYTNFTPTLGYYSNYDQTLLRTHIGMMQYARIQVGISSWWGQGSQTDSKVPGLLQAASGTNFRWSLYYEAESNGDPTVSQIQNDLSYIRNHYGADPSFLRINGKFVVFVYAAGNDACGMADRWKRANTVGAYVVLKVFSGYANCASQPDNWHQYSPAVATSSQSYHSYSISPGFWQKNLAIRLPRDIARFQQNVRDMVASGAQWQLVTTFSEWGEGTAVESAREWASPSGYGQYLDALHYNGNMP